MEHKASPRRRAGAGDRQEVRGAVGGAAVPIGAVLICSGPCLQLRAGWKGRLPPKISLLFRTSVCRRMCSCPKLRGGGQHT